MQVDTANMLAGGGDPVQCLRKYPGRAATMHLKEHSKDHPEALLGEGDMDRHGYFDKGGDRNVRSGTEAEIVSQIVDNGVERQ